MVFIKQKKISAFNLTEILLALAIIGVVAAITIPTVIGNYQQTQYKTGLRKAINVLNDSITLSLSQDGDTPLENHDLFNFLQKNISVIKTFGAETRGVCAEAKLQNGAAYAAPAPSGDCAPNGTFKFVTKNAGFYTTDGMLFEFSGYENAKNQNFKLHESNITPCTETVTQKYFENDGTEAPASSSNTCGGCGSLGLTKNPNNTKKAPCIITVDVNGNGEPNAPSIERKVYPKINEKRTTDVFSVMITETGAIPFGIVAQRAMYSTK